MTTVALRKKPEQRDGAELPPSIAVGALLDEKYRVESVLGRGGMADVFRARHEQLGHRVAVKVLRPELTCPSFAKRALREARAAAGLTSEHVTRVLDIGTLPTGEPFLVMELLEGIDFAELLRRRGPLTLNEAAGYLLQVCDALGEAHDGGIVHRDLKPSNLFLGSRRDGTPLVKLMDFGISKIEGETADDAPADPLTVPREILGTPHYMSPEQLTNPRNVDCRTDIWALGVLLFRLLTAEFPFAGESPGSVLSQIASQPPVPLRAKRPDLPEALEELVNRCLEKSPDDRLPSARAFARTLLDFCSEDDRRRYAHVADSEAPAPPRLSSDTVRTSTTHPLSPRVEGHWLETHVEWPPRPAEGDLELTVAGDVAAEASDEPTIAPPVERAPEVGSSAIELAVDALPMLPSPELPPTAVAALSHTRTRAAPAPPRMATPSARSGRTTTPPVTIAVSTDPVPTIRATTPLVLTTTSMASTDPAPTIRTMSPVPSLASTAPPLTVRTARRRTAVLWAGAVGVIVGATAVGALARILTSAPPPGVEPVAAPGPSATAAAHPVAASDLAPSPVRGAAPASAPASVAPPMSVIPLRTPEPMRPATQTPPSLATAQPQTTPSQAAPSQATPPQATPSQATPSQTTQPQATPSQTMQPHAAKTQPHHGEARSRDPYGDRL